jgi:response regulator NasT
MTQSASARDNGTAASLTKRTLIIEDDTLVGIGLRSHLEKLGHHVVGQAADAGQAIAKYHDETPDLVLVDIRLDHDDGIQLAAHLMSERRCPMIIVSAFSDASLVERAAAAGVYGYLVKPVTREALAAQIQVAVSRFDETEKLRREKDDLHEAFETRKLVDRAKGILMKRLSLDEPAAHRRLQSESQKRRVSMAEIARKVIESEKLLGD